MKNVLLVALLLLLEFVMYAQSGGCGNNLTWHFNTSSGELVIKGRGRMTSYSDTSPAPWAKYGEQIEIVELPQAIESIGNYAFCNCKQIESLTLPNGIQEIGKNAFQYCTKLKQIYIPESVKSIGDYAFNGSGIEDISLPDNVTEIHSSTFRDCNKLRSIRLPSSLRRIGSEAFSNCASLKRVILPKTMEIVDRDAFSDCPIWLPIFVNNEKGSIDVKENAFGQSKVRYYPSRCSYLLEIEDVFLLDPCKFNILIGGTHCFILAKVVNYGTSTSEICHGLVKFIDQNNVLSSEVVTIEKIAPNQSVEVCFPIYADPVIKEGFVRFVIQLQLNNEDSINSGVYLTETRPHGTTEKELSFQGHQYRKSAISLIKEARSENELLSAAEEFNKITETDPYYANAYYNMGKIYATIAIIKGDPYFQKAIDMFKKYLLLWPEDKEVIDAEMTSIRDSRKYYWP